MLDAETIADELWAMAEIRPDAILHRAVERIHQMRAAYDWVGVYLVGGPVLIIHSYIGTDTDWLRIPFGEGVCGTAVAEERDINVPDVSAVAGYRARRPETRSELVVLIRDGERVLGLVDLESDAPAAFSESDQRSVQTIADTLGELLGTRLA